MSVVFILRMLLKPKLQLLINMHSQLARIVEGIQTGHLEPIVDRVFDAEDVQAAHQYIHDAKNIGKVLLKFEDVGEE